MNEIKENHERYLKTHDAIEKIKIAAKNMVLQVKAANKAMNQLKGIAIEFGYTIDEDTGELKIKS